MYMKISGSRSMCFEMYFMNRGELKQDIIAKTGLEVSDSWKDFSLRPRCENLVQQYHEFSEATLSREAVSHTVSSQVT